MSIQIVCVKGVSWFNQMININNWFYVLLFLIMVILVSIVWTPCYCMNKPLVSLLISQPTVQTLYYSIFLNWISVLRSTHLTVTTVVLVNRLMQVLLVVSIMVMQTNIWQNLRSVTMVRINLQKIIVGGSSLLYLWVMSFLKKTSSNLCSQVSTTLNWEVLSVFWVMIMWVTLSIVNCLLYATIL